MACELQSLVFPGRLQMLAARRPGPGATSGGGEAHGGGRHETTAPRLVLALFIAAQPGAAQEQLAFDVPRGSDRHPGPAERPRHVGATRPAPAQVGVISVYRPEAFAGTAQDFHRLIVQPLDHQRPRAGIHPPATVGALQVTNIHQQMPNGVQFWTRIYTGRWADRGQAIILITNAPDLLARFTPAADSMMSRIVVPQAVAAAPAPGQPQSAPATAPTNTASSGRGATGEQHVRRLRVPGTGGLDGQPAGNWAVGGLAARTLGRTLHHRPVAHGAGEQRPVCDAQRAWAQVFSGLTIRPDDPLNRTLLVRALAPQGWEYVILRRPIVSPNDRESSLGGTVMRREAGRSRRDHLLLLGDPPTACATSTAIPFIPRCGRASLRASASGTGRVRRDGPAGESRAAGSRSAPAPAAGRPPVRVHAGRPLRLLRRGAALHGLSHFEAAVWTSRPSATGRTSSAATELTLRPDRDGDPDQFLFRLEQVSEDGGRTWTEKLFMMQPTKVITIDGPAMHDNEIALERRNPKARRGKLTLGLSVGPSLLTPARDGFDRGLDSLWG